MLTVTQMLGALQPGFVPCQHPLGWQLLGPPQGAVLDTPGHGLWSPGGDSAPSPGAVDRSLLPAAGLG